MNKMIISIIAILVFSAMVFSTEAASAEFIALGGAGNANYSAGNNLIFSCENNFILSAGVLIGLGDFPPIDVHMLRTVEQGKHYRHTLKSV